MSAHYGNFRNVQVNLKIDVADTLKHNDAGTWTPVRPVTYYQSTPPTVVGTPGLRENDRWVDTTTTARDEYLWTGTAWSKVASLGAVAGGNVYNADGATPLTQLSNLHANLGDITAGTLTLNAAGYMRGGRTSFADDTHAGYFLGYESANYVFKIGNSVGGAMTKGWYWDGSDLHVLASTATISGPLSVDSVGPHVIGSSVPNNEVMLSLRGSFPTAGTNVMGLYQDSTLTPAVGGMARGVALNPTLVRAGSGTHPLFATLQLEAPTITGGAAAITNAATLYLSGAPTEASNNYALWVDAGNARLDGSIDVRGTANNAIGGATPSATAVLVLPSCAAGPASLRITPGVDPTPTDGDVWITSAALKVRINGSTARFSGTSSGTNTGDQTSVSGNAGSATTTAITDDTSTNATMYPSWVTTASGNQAQKVSSTVLTWNPATKALGVGAPAIVWGTAIGGAVAVGNQGAVVGFNGETLYAHNYYWETTGKYIANGEAAAIDVVGNAFCFLTAPSGTAGTLITFREQVRVNHTASADRYITLTGSNGGNPTIGVSAGSLAVTPATVFASTIAASNFSGTSSGTNTGDQTTVSGNAGSASTVAIADDTTTNAWYYPVWVAGASGNQAAQVSSSRITFNPSTGQIALGGLTVASYRGQFIGNNVPATGSGVEIGPTSIVSFNRDSGAYTGLSIYGVNPTIYAKPTSGAGTTVLTVSGGLTVKVDGTNAVMSVDSDSIDVASGITLTGTGTAAVTGFGSVSAGGLYADAATADLGFRTSGLNRWIWEKAGTESGGNAGGDLTLYRYDDAGAYLGAVVTCTRSSGAVSFGSNPVTAGAISGTTGAFSSAITATSDSQAYAQRLILADTHAASGRTWGLFNGYRGYGIATLQISAAAGGDAATGIEVQRWISTGTSVTGTFGVSGQADLSTGATTATVNIGALNGDRTGNLNFISTNTGINWRISSQGFLANALDFVPSTAGGGTTFTTPVLRLLTAGVSVTGTFGVSGLTTLRQGQTSTIGTTPGLQIANADDAATVGNFIQLGFHYAGGSIPAAVVGSVLTATSGYTYSDLIFATRAVDTNTAPTERMRIRYDGNVGIGTAGPSAKLAINGGLHVGGDSDPGDNNALIDGTLVVTLGIDADSFEVTGTGLVFDGTVGGTGTQHASFGNTGGLMYVGVERSTGSGLFTGAAAYAAVIGDVLGNPLHLATNGIARVTVSAAGETTMPAQPAFLAFNSAADLNQTGTGTWYTIVCDSEVFDQNADYNNGTGVFTASVAGRHPLSGTVLITGTTNNTIAQSRITTSNRTHFLSTQWTLAGNDNELSGSTLADMDAGDTAIFEVAVWGEAGDTDDVFGHATSLYTHFEGRLAC